MSADQILNKIRSIQGDLAVLFYAMKCLPVREDSHMNNADYLKDCAVNEVQNAQHSLGYVEEQVINFIKTNE
jgi:hypothetical protein